MIQVTRINGSDIWLNPVLIESLEKTPDTIVTLSNGHKYVVQEAPEAITDAVAAWMRAVGIIGSLAHRGDSERKGEGV